MYWKQREKINRSIDIMKERKKERKKEDSEKLKWEVSSDCIKNKSQNAMQLVRFPRQFLGRHLNFEKDKIKRRKKKEKNTFMFANYTN